MDMICSFRTEATLVANIFIDEYMASANGEYVKVYLYLLRHQHETVDVDRIADALNHTESDVRRALAYWERLGALRIGQQTTQEKSFGTEKTGLQQEAAAREDQESGISEWKPEEPEIIGEAGKEKSGETRTGREKTDRAAHKRQAGACQSAPVSGRRPVYSQDQVNSLAGDEDFAQLLYIAQKYMDKVFTSRECEVFAYLYDGLHMTSELLEYLVEYCVQNGHTSIRYIETVGLSWHEKGLLTVEAARAYASGFTKDSFAVMRCFGLTDRKPGEAEKQMIEKWFSVYGFSRELVLEACNRTMEATHSPSFKYADKIMEEWKKAGVKTVRDIAALDEEHQGKKAARTVKKPANQFHNFNQRSTDYDAMVLDQVKTWIGQS